MRSQGLVASMVMAVVLSGCARTDSAADAGRAPPVLDPHSVELTSASLVGAGTFAQNRGHSNGFIDTATEPMLEPQELDGSICTQNCSGHDAGYEWAAQNAIADPNDCGGDSDSFVEGCMAYAQDQKGDRDSHAE